MSGLVAPWHDASESDNGDPPSVDLEQRRRASFEVVFAGSNGIQAEAHQVLPALQHGLLAVILTVVVAKVGHVLPGRDGCRIGLRVAPEGKLLRLPRAIRRRRALEIDDRQIIVEENAIQPGPGLLIALRTEDGQDIRVEVDVTNGVMTSDPFGFVVVVKMVLVVAGSEVIVDGSEDVVFATVVSTSATGV